MAVINNLPNGAQGLTKEVLWRNPNPNSAFAAQEITINFSDYDYLLFEFKNSTSTTTVHQVLTTVTDMIEKDNGYARPLALFGYSTPLNTNICRFIYSNSSDKIGFGSCTIYTSSSLSNTWLIPLYVYGVKGEIK